MRRRRRLLLPLLALALPLLAAPACGGGSTGEVEVVIPEGAGALQVAERLEDAGLVTWPRFFAAYVALRGTDDSLKSGRYRFAAGASWATLASALERGAVVTVPVTLPEGLRLSEAVERLAAVTRVDTDSLLTLASDSTLVDSLGVPGPSLEGYLFPETYRFAEGTEPRRVLATPVERYRDFWTRQRRALADSLGLSEQEVVTLASIVEAEARVPEERSTIAAVYLNRLERGMLLQADPTVQYALGEQKERLLYADIDSVADDPFNTYTHPGLPPGPIGSPGEASLSAVLHPADVPYLYFVARPDGSHVFSETHAEHLRAKNRIRG